MLAKTPVKGFLIDPIAKAITEVEYTGLQSLYKHIGCELVDIVYMNEQRDGIFVDDEGLIHGTPTHFFYVEGFHSPLAGRGVVLGCDSEGESVSPQAVTLDWLREHVAFIERLAPFAISVTSKHPELALEVGKFF